MYQYPHYKIGGIGKYKIMKYKIGKYRDLSYFKKNYQYHNVGSQLILKIWCWKCNDKCDQVCLC